MTKCRSSSRVAGAGRVALAGLALEVFEAVDDTVVRWAHALGAPEHRYPSLIDAAVLQRASVAIPSSPVIPRLPAREGKVSLVPADC